MPNLRDIKRRIGSVKNTQQITKAMKLVAASKLRKAQEAILNERPYAVKLMEVLHHLAARCNKDLHPLLNQREEKKVLFIVVTSDKGLCGGFNGNVLKRLMAAVEENAGKEISVVAMGKKGRDICRSRGLKIEREYLNWGKDFEYQRAAEMAKFISEMFVDGKVDKVSLVYNEFKSVIQQEVILEQLLPIVPEDMATDSDGKMHDVDYIYEPDEESILETLLGRYMAVEIYRACLESTASEHGARMTAMDSATRNAGEMIDDLTLFYNRARQAYITKELIEVVNGAEALKG